MRKTADRFERRATRFTHLGLRNSKVGPITRRDSTNDSEYPAGHRVISGGSPSRRPRSRLLGEARTPPRRGSPQTTFRHQRFDSGFRARHHVAGRASISLRATRRDGAPQAGRHRAAAGARTDMLFDHSLSGGCQIAVEVSRDFQQQLAAPSRRLELGGHLSPSLSAA
jgi:hypothetical protein